jgi:nucleoid-associated protein YgaU
MRIFTTHLARSLIISVALTLLASGCNKPPAHQVNISPPQTPEAQAEQEPAKLNEIRPLDTSQAQPTDPRHGRTPPTISETSPDSAQPSPVNARPYRIQQGDTYWKIAAKQLGNGHRWKEIEELNPHQDRTKLAVGQVIKIPAK